MTAFSLHTENLSLKHDRFSQVLADLDNLLVIQDLDGVCMGLVKDPLSRVISPDYVRATRAFEDRFYVLTNGEHIGTRGVNGIIDRSFNDPDYVKQQGFYLPGLAAGGVQWQNNYGAISHPGVSDAEMEFLAAVPAKIATRLNSFFQDKEIFQNNELSSLIQASVLENKVSPTANLNTFHEKLGNRKDIYLDLQREMRSLMAELLAEARSQGLQDSFFVHYAPNLGRDEAGKEIIWLAREKDSGTTDFQFMLTGAIKEAGVLSLLNKYYCDRTGKYPLGEHFSVRIAPQNLQELLNLVKNNFDPQYMPFIVGIGDTVTSIAKETENGLTFGRGGSDRNFLQLVQNIGREFNTGNLVVYIDSSAGEVKNRKAIKLAAASELKVIEGPGDPRDTEDPLRLNIVFPGGHEQYIQYFCKAANDRKLKRRKKVN